MHAPDPFPSTDPEARFDALAAEWERATRFMSSIQQMSMHPAYQRIIGMGPVAVPLILRRMSGTPGHWFWALEAITDASPVEPAHQGRVDLMTQDWLRWASVKGVLAQS